MPIEKKVVAIYAGGLSEHSPRYVIVDKCTGELLDDAQGYGYTSKQKAYRAWTYKTKSTAEKRKKDATQRKVEGWCWSHPAVVDDLRELMVIKAKQDPDGKGRLSQAEAVKCLQEHGVKDLPVSVAELLIHFPS